MMSEPRKPCGLHCIKVSNLSVEIGGKRIIEDINMHIHCGVLQAIIGKNGAGKSTLIKAILGEVPHTGKITFQDHEDGNMQKLKIGYVPQSINIDKNTPISVYDLIAGFDTRVPVFFKKSKKAAERIYKALAAFGAGEFIDEQVSSLSGGELQRVLLAMAVMDEPNLLILDEPVSGIDKNGMELFYRNIQSLKENYDLAVILVSHDLEYVARYADQVMLLDTRILEQGTVEEVYGSPKFQEVFGLPFASAKPGPACAGKMHEKPGACHNRPEMGEKR